MVWRKYRRIFILFLVILSVNFFKIIILNNDNIVIINPSIYPKYSIISDNYFFDGYKNFNTFNINNSILLNFESPGFHIIINNSNYKYKNNNEVIIIYKNNFKNYNIDGIDVLSQFNIYNLNTIIEFLKEHNLKLPNKMYIYNLNYKQSFFLPKNNFFIKKNDLSNGILVHELSHYTFGYIIKRKNTQDIWPEILCEAIRLNFLKNNNIELYESELNYKNKNPNLIYSKIINYSFILKYFDKFINTFIDKFQGKIISDKDFNNFYSAFERREID